jgi:hypothetical protein
MGVGADDTEMEESEWKMVPHLYMQHQGKHEWQIQIQQRTLRDDQLQISLVGDGWISEKSHLHKHIRGCQYLG